MHIYESEVRKYTEIDTLSNAYLCDMLTAYGKDKSVIFHVVESDYRGTKLKAFSEDKLGIQKVKKKRLTSL